MAKIKAYNGDEPYIFISYAHKNSDVVIPIIERLMADGYRVWYDEGIEPGTNWDEYIADHINGSGCVLAMISEEYMDSSNCLDELNYTRDVNKPTLMLYISPITLPPGMQMRFNRSQALFKYNYKNESEFYAKLQAAKILKSCKAGVQKPAVAEKAEDFYRPIVEKKNSVGKGIIIGIICALLIVIGVLVYFMLNNGSVALPGGEPGEVHTHNYVDIAETPPTCTKSGLTAGRKCDDCGNIETEQQVVEALGHEYGSDGTCQRCNMRIPSVGLEFKSNGDGTYAVVGIGSCTDTYLVIPSETPDGKKVTSIGVSAFLNCNKITKVSIPETIISIGNKAFSGTDAIRYENGISYVDKWVVDSEKSLKKVTLKNGTLGIASSAFEYCKSLTEIVIPESVVCVGKWAFSGCSALKSIILPDNIIRIETGALYNCTKLESVTVPFLGLTADAETNTHIGYLFGGNTYSDNNNSIPSTLKSVAVTGETKIGAYAFYKCSSITKVTLAEGIKEIGNYAFYDCTSLKSISVPDSAERIGDFAYYNCSSVENVVIGGGVRIIGEKAFAYSKYIIFIRFRGTTAEWNSVSKGKNWDTGIGNYTMTCED